jgi:hypothetical protein
LSKEVKHNGHFSKLSILQLYLSYYKKKNALCCSKPGYTRLQFCNYDTIKIHFKTAEKQQANNKQFSFKTQTHTAFREYNSYILSKSSYKSSNFNYFEVLCFAHGHSFTTHHNSFMYVLETMFSICGLFWFTALLSHTAWSTGQSVLYH